MKVETVTPGDYLGDVIGDINRRRGPILDQLERGTNIAVVATVPLSEMFGYIGQLRGMTSGRASYTMEFSHYEPVPRNVADEVIEAASKAKAASRAEDDGGPVWGRPRAAPAWPGPAAFQRNAVRLID